jgi:hypothetical protein
MNEEIAERILTATLPHCPTWADSSPDFAIQDAGIACAGMPAIWFHAVYYRVLGDWTSGREVYRRLRSIAYGSKHKPVKRRAGRLAALVLAEDSSPWLVEQKGLTPILLGISRQQYRRDLHPVHMDLRARLEAWARGGLNHIVRRAG